MSLEFDYYSLGDLVKIKYGKNQKKVQDDENGKYPIYGTGGLMGYSIDYLYDKPSVLIGRKGSIEKVRYIEEPFWTVDTLFYTEVNEEIVIPKFLYYVMSLIDLSRYNEGTSIPSLRTETLNRLDIPIPNLDYQKRVLTVLSNIDKKISINEEINKNLLKISKKIYEEWFLNYEFPNNEGKPYKTNDGKFKDTEFGTIPVDWNIGLLENIIDFQNGYSFKSGDLLKEEKPNCYAIFKMGNIIKGGGFNPSATKSWIKKSESSDLSKYLIKKGDLLMCMTDMKGNVALLGHTALMDVDNEYLLNQRVGLLRVSNDIEIDYPYLYLLTNHHIFLTNLRGRANSGVQVNLSTKEIKHSKIIIPPKIVNQKFNKVVKPIFDIIFNNNIEIQKLTKTRDTLLPKLMSGEVDVSKINYDLE